MSDDPNTTWPEVLWQEAGQHRQGFWLGSRQAETVPHQILPVDDSLTAEQAYRHATAGTAMLWRGDYHNARQLLQALARRIDKRAQRAQKNKAQVELGAAEVFYRQRQQQAHRARLLGMLLVELDGDYQCDLRRAPQVQAACEQAFAAAAGDSLLIRLRDLLGVVGAAQWRTRGVPVHALDVHIHPHYGVFAPTRQEYVELLLQAPLPDRVSCAYDIGVGTGVLSIALAQRGITRIVATDMSAQALACAADNLQRLGLTQVELQQADVFPQAVEPADIIVCNPPWLPGRPGSLLEYAVYDPDSAMLRTVLAGARQHLTAQGQLWLVLSDLAEHLGLRSREQLLQWIEQAGLRVEQRLDTPPTHQRSQDSQDPLHAYRSQEITSLWILAPS